MDQERAAGVGLRVLALEQVSLILLDFRRTEGPEVAHLDPGHASSELLRTSGVDYRSHARNLYWNRSFESGGNRGDAVVMLRRQVLRVRYRRPSDLER